MNDEPSTGGTASWPCMLAALRAAGWSVAVHNDYEMRGRRLTFWLLTRRGGASVKGEGADDAAALADCLAAAGLPDRDVPPAPGADPGSGALARLRDAGWQVGLHNDYRLDGLQRTFWRMVHPPSGTYRDGEGDTDGAALATCLEACLPPPRGRR